MLMERFNDFFSCGFDVYCVLFCLSDSVFI